MGNKRRGRVHIKSRVLCGNPACWRAICHPSTSKNFCCDLCEASYFNGTQSRHGSSCDPDEVDWSGPRASPEPTDHWSWRSGEHWTSGWDEDPGGAECGGEISPRRKVVTAPTPQAPEREEARVESPPDLIWEVVPRVVPSDLEVQKRLTRFLTRSWSGHLSEARTLPAPRRLEAFVQGWISDTLYRLYQAVECLKDSLSAQASADLFAELCAHGLPLEVLGCERSPPLNWQTVPRVVNRIYRELYPNGDFEEAASSSPQDSDARSSGGECHGERQTSMKARGLVLNSGERSRSRSRPRPSQRATDPSPLPSTSDADETRQCAASFCTGRGVFVDEGTGAYYCDACWSCVVLDKLMLAASCGLHGTTDFPLPSLCDDVSDAPSDEESISAFRTKLTHLLKP